MSWTARMVKYGLFWESVGCSFEINCQIWMDVEFVQDFMSGLIIHNFVKIPWQLKQVLQINKADGNSKEALF